MCHLWTDVFSTKRPEPHIKCCRTYLLCSAMRIFSFVFSHSPGMFVSIQPLNPPLGVQALHRHHTPAPGHLGVTLSLLLLELSELSYSLRIYCDLFPRRAGIVARSTRAHTSGGQRPRTPEQTPCARWPCPPWSHGTAGAVLGGSVGEGTETVHQLSLNLRSALKRDTVHLTVELLKCKNRARIPLRWPGRKNAHPGTKRCLFFLAELNGSG